MPENAQKLCVVCGKDCAGQPRLKDDKGRYVHQACAKKAKQGASSKPKDAGAGAVPLAPTGGVMDNLVNEALADAPQPCQNCARPVSRDAIICTHCGFNRESGKATRTHVEKYREPSKAGAAAATAGRVGLVAATPLFAVIGAAIGALIGGAVWYWIVRTTGYEIGYVAVGVGIVTAFCTQAAVRFQGNLLYGLIAAVFALGAIAGARYAFIDKLVSDVEAGDFFTADMVEDSDVLQVIVDDIANERLDAGEDIDWPDPGITLDDAVWPFDYPLDLRAEAEERWDSMPPDEQRAVREKVIARVQTMFTVNRDEIVEDGFTSSIDFFDIIFGCIAIAAAFGGASKSFDEFG